MIHTYTKPIKTNIAINKADKKLPNVIKLFARLGSDDAKVNFTEGNVEFKTIIKIIVRNKTIKLIILIFFLNEKWLLIVISEQKPIKPIRIENKSIVSFCKELKVIWLVLVIK
ncbi:hypothetical protein [uncultured Clostridium sp.]|uniref:hypothetical protein n=1 Tax=uncultured Clostridium sp. TaxID=59620 RepID=UPI002635D6AE|nr:hypothetical protein [uncultured Clostridium sp.]